MAGDRDDNRAEDRLAIAPGSRLDLGVPGCFLLRLQSFRDNRGAITVAETDTIFPFRPARVFFVRDVPSPSVRGEHAHRRCAQALCALKGSVTVSVEDGRGHAATVHLSHPTVALHIPPMIWAAQTGFTDGALLAVFASHAYDAADYLRTQADFRKAVAEGPA